MSKMKIFFYLIASLFFISILVSVAAIFGTASFVKVSDRALYDKLNNELYEFSEPDTLNAFLIQKASEGGKFSLFKPSHKQRTQLVRTYHQVGKSEHLIQTAYGGEYGGTIYVRINGSLKIEGIVTSMDHKGDYQAQLPAQRYGNIIAKSKIKCRVYQIESKSSGKKSWAVSGKYTVKSSLKSWYEPVYW